METKSVNAVTSTGECQLLRWGRSLMCKRVYRDASIVLSNVGKTEARLTVLWLNDVDEDHGESQFNLQIPSGSTIEFEQPQNESAGQFLDTIILDHISGGDVEVSCMVPIELLN